MTGDSAGREGLKAVQGFVLTSAFAVGGAAVFLSLGLPAAILLGAMTATFAAAMAGVKLVFPNWLRSAILVAIGISVGGSLDPDTFAGAARWVPSFAGLTISLMASLLIGALFLRRVGRMDAATAFYAAFPGHLVMVLDAAVSSRADVPKVAVIQSLRLVVLVMALPGVLSLASSGVVMIPEPTVWLNVAVAAIVGLAGWPIARFFRFPAETLTGPILGSAVAAFGGFPLGTLPPMVEQGMLLIVGAMIGSRFVGTRLSSFLGMLPLSLAGVAVVLLVTAAFALPVSMMLDLPFNQVLLAYSPGGADVMAVIALAMGLDPTFVGMHHCVRLLVMAGVLPWLGGQYQQAAEAEAPLSRRTQ